MNKPKQEVLIWFEGDYCVYTIAGVTYREKITKEEVKAILEEVGFAAVFKDQIQ